jgi:predicted small lipoprotein YifL
MTLASNRTFRYGAGDFRSVLVIGRDRLAVRAATILALALALGVAACGRKGPLDPPPSASAPAGPTAEAGAAAPANNTGAAPSKRIPLDVLLD